MSKPLLFLLSLFIFACTPSFSHNAEFSQQNAEAMLKHLVLEIGPRPMGSPAEQRALHFAADKFKEYGCDTSYVLPMTVAEGVNTKSGVAVGVKKGKTDRIIVIGGHIDSSGPDVPGANDDGSGTACVLELARVLCNRETESTVYFCCWGGEEQGLRGSTYFVDTFDHLDSVALMLQIDMADGSSYLIADPDGSKASAPSWLVQSAFSIFYDDLNLSGLVYQTESSTLNLAAGGTFGSDHIPFLDRGIPAIDFTSDVSFPIHTPQDTWDNFTPSGLKRSGDLVLKVFEKYDAGIPSRTTEQYQLLQFGSSVFFLPYFFLRVFIGLSLVVGIVAFFIVRARRAPRDPAGKIKWSHFKLLIAALVIQTFVWSSETIVGLIKGYRFPWVNNQSGFLILGLLFGLLGLWFVLQGLRRYRLSADAYVFARFALIAIVILTLLASYVTPELGLYLAASLFCFSLAVMVKKPGAMFVLFAAALLVICKLVFFDGLELFQRVMTQNQMSVWWQKALVHLGFIIIAALLSLPFMHGFATIYRASGVDVLWLKRFRRKAGLAVTSLAAVGMIFYLLTRPVYGKLWHNVVRVHHEYRIGADTSSLTVRGSEYFGGLAATINGRDTMFAGRTNSASLAEAKEVPVRWGHTRSEISQPTRVSDTTWSVERMLEVHSRFRPFRINVIYESASPFEVQSHWAHGAKSADPRLRESDTRKVFRWYSFPDTSIRIPVTFTLSDTQRVREVVEVVFDTVGYPIRLRREFTNVEYRTTVTAADTFMVGKR